jgi:transcriptional regulator with XRE-family HTH domain
LNNSLKYFRDQKGLTQAGLAGMIKKPDGKPYAPQTIAAYEQYGRPLPPEFLSEAARALGVSEGELQSPRLELRDEAASAYRALDMPVDVIPDEALKELANALVDKMQKMRAEDPMRERTAAVVMTISKEIRARMQIGPESAEAAIENAAKLVVKGRKDIK